MKIFGLVALTGALLPAHMKADDIAEPNRMLVNQSNGKQEVYVIDNIESMQIVTIPESRAEIALREADDSYVSVGITMTEGCKRWEATCIPASLGLDELALKDYISANYAYNYTCDEDIEFIDLDSSTGYMVATLSYDEYGLPCEVSTLEFTTLAAPPSGPAQIGGYLYRDGSWSTDLKRTKQPVGIIFSTEVAEEDAARGYHNGYAVAFGEIAAAEWTTEAGENESGASFNGNNDADINDMNGLSHTLALLENENIHPAARLAREYGPVPPESSGWFIPGAGQMIDIFCGLGNLDRSAMSRADSGIAEWPQAEAAQAIELVNSKLEVAGEGNYSPLSVYTWTSTERSVMSAYYIYANPVLNISLPSYNKDAKFAVRPIIAF